jgi:UrcA family protein
MTYQPCSIVRSTLFAVAMLAGAPFASAQEADTAPRVEIDLAGIDLATPEGIDAARHRINGAARAVCSTVVDPDGWHMQQQACVYTARGQANRQLADLREKVLAQRTRKTVDYAMKER